MTTTTPDVLALTAALDAGDDLALVALADALEDCPDHAVLETYRVVRGDSPPDASLCGRPAIGRMWRSVLDALVAGLRRVGDRRPRRHYDGWYGWRGTYRQFFDPDAPCVDGPWDIPARNQWDEDGQPEVYDRLEGWSERDHAGRYYPTRSAAFLALAAALIQE